MKIRIILFVLLVVFIASCFDMKEEVWINADKTARFKLDVGIAKATLEQLKAFSQMAATQDPGKQGQPASTGDIFDDMKADTSELTKNPDVAKADVTTYEDKDTKHLVVDVTIKDFQKLSSINDIMEKEKSAQSDSPAEEDSKMTLTKVDDTTYDFSMMLLAKQTAKDAAQDASLESMAVLMFADKYFSFTLHAPEIVSSNGTKVDAQTISWKIPLTERMQLKENKKWEARIKLAQPGMVDSVINKVKGLFK